MTVLLVVLSAKSYHFYFVFLTVGSQRGFGPEKWQYDNGIFFFKQSFNWKVSTIR